MKKLLINSLAIFLLLLPTLALAQSGQNSGSQGSGQNSGGTSIYKINIPSPLKMCQGSTPGSDCSIPGLLNVIINNIVVPIGGVVAALMIMYAGFLYVTARGDTAQIKKAHEALLYGCIGAAILLGAKVIATAIKGTIDQL